MSWYREQLPVTTRIKANLRVDKITGCWYWGNAANKTNRYTSIKMGNSYILLHRYM